MPLIIQPRLSLTKCEGPGFPSSPTDGQYFVDYCTSTLWRFSTVLNQWYIPGRASGGDNIYTISVGGVPYRVHEFTRVATSTLTMIMPSNVEYLIVAGGGGSGGARGDGPYISGGGGAGGLLQGNLNLTAQTYSITVGGGGAGGPSSGAKGVNGDNSSAFGFTCIGGGGGGGGLYESPLNNSGISGGSGGGGTGGRMQTIGTGGAGTAGQGFSGGAGTLNNGGSGGGKGGAGSTGGVGGVGIQSNITGISKWYAGGGSSGEVTGVSLGGGGRGDGTAESNLATDGEVSTGGGGGGRRNLTTSGNAFTGKSGGSGIVIVRYRI